MPRTGTKPSPAKFTNAKGRTLSAFTVFALCHGQSQLGSLGYAPLPPNLVRDGLQQATRIPGHGPIPTPQTVTNRPSKLAEVVTESGPRASG